MVSMVVAVVSIQLLKSGLVNHMSDGDTLSKDERDVLVIIAICEFTIAIGSVEHRLVIYGWSDSYTFILLI
mgnify:CR=1 FL=1